MSRIQVDGAYGINIEPEPLGITHHHANVIHAVSGALGRRLWCKPLLADVLDEKGEVNGRYISAKQAESALQRLFGSSPGNAEKPSLLNLVQMDPIVLSMMMTQLVLSVSSSNAQSLCQQLERATDVQNVLRDKQVKEYQEQIQKAVEQADKARKAGIVNMLFDWVIALAEVSAGLMKMIEGVLTADPLEIVDGAAYFVAGEAGMVKAGAETAMLLGADKDTCQSIINSASTVQSSCEFVALALDLIQIGRAFTAARAVTSATEKVLDSGLSEKILESGVNTTEKELQALAQEVGEAVGKRLGQDFGPAEREMVEIGDMAREAIEFASQAEANMVKDMGKSFTRAGVEAMVKSAVEAGVKKLLKTGEELTEEKLRDAILAKLRVEIMRTVVTDGVNKTLQLVRATAKGAEQISSGVVALETAEIRKMIEHLITQQNFIDFVESWTENHKQSQQKRLQEAYQDSATAIKSTLEMIDNYGSVLATMAWGRA